ncbi:hypothetical protein PC117_g27137 [Phytophthora cactorum]|uniref:Crinkler effector protein N-terminal domain-containing protein n=1 Tax=Phytophthora cactorum TaxID=29920 RepID=A0A8T1AF57_9STRA|nr:hypothetical protein PC117_g27137 [Phytophthora cactorum]
MITLYCAVVGVAGSAFPVDIDENKSVGHLKDAIKEKKMYQFPADELQLFLAKKGDGAGAWLTEKDVKEGVSDTTGLKLLDAVRAEIGDVGLSQDDVRLQVAKEEVAALKGPVHVLVVVPEQWTSAPIVSQDGVFDHCMHPFFSQFPTVDQVGDWLEFPALLPLTERQKLYVRCSYKSIAAQALTKVDPNRRKYAVITGTPGIGKSVFVYYVMWRLIKDKKRVLFITRQPPIYFDGSTIHDGPNKCCWNAY